MELIRLTTIIVAISFVTVFKAQANLSSPYTSSVSGLTIPNAHIVTEHSRSFVIRGQAPGVSGIDQLLSMGVERVLIFKNDTKGEVQKEIVELKRKGLSDQDILHISMPWKEARDFQSLCEMTLESMKFLEESVRTRRSVFFHCTMGEDRTGYLSGLWSLWSGEIKDVNQAFREEMCAKGYEAGNLNKPHFVASAVRETLTPTFVKMVQLLGEARMKGLKLNQIRCPKEIQMQRSAPKCR